MLPDYLAPNLDIVFVGINPGEYSDRVGHYFARKNNSFWTGLYEAGLVPERLLPSDDSRLLQFGYGLTDIVKRATPNADYVTRSEFEQGAKILRAKLERLEPRLVCFVGLVGYRQGFDSHAVPGVQNARWGRTCLFLVPSTSPRNARYHGETVEWFRRLKEILKKLKSEDY